MKKTELYKQLMGKEIEFDCYLRRTNELAEGSRIKHTSYLKYTRDWEERSCAPTTGIITGVRHRRSGYWYGLDGGFTITGKVKTLLVYIHPLKNPRIVPFRFAEPLIDEILNVDLTP